MMRAPFMLWGPPALLISVTAVAAAVAAVAAVVVSIWVLYVCGSIDRFVFIIEFSLHAFNTNATCTLISVGCCCWICAALEVSRQLKTRRKTEKLACRTRKMNKKRLRYSN